MTRIQEDVQAESIWQLGRNCRIACGDCRDAAIVDRLFSDMSGKRILLGDSPFCSGGRNESKRIHRNTWGAMPNDNLTTHGYQNLIQDTIKVSRPDKAYFFNTWIMLRPLMDAIERSNMILNNTLIWDKMSPGMGRPPFRSQLEFIVYCVNLNVSTPMHKKGMGAKGNVLRHKRAKKSESFGPTPKPISLYAELIAAELMVKDPEEDIVFYDPYLGGSNSMIACLESGVPFIGIDLQPKFILTALQRYTEMTGIVPVEIQP